MISSLTKGKKSVTFYGVMGRHSIDYLLIYANLNENIRVIVETCTRSTYFFTKRIHHAIRK